MKPSYMRRIRRKPAVSQDTPLFKKETKEGAFFGASAQDTFFQPQSPAVQCKSEKGEEEDKQVKHRAEKKEEEKKIDRKEDKKEEEKKVDRKEDKKEEEKDFKMEQKK
jgi:hypothetical protein